MPHGTYIPSGKALGDCDLLLVGDSIANRGKEEFASLMLARHGADVAVNYWSSRPTAPAVDFVISASELPKRIVMACGTNDIMNPPVMAAQIVRLKQYLLDRGAADGKQYELFWVDVQAARPAYGIADQRNSGWVNNQIHDNIAFNRLISWFRWFAVAPARFEDYIATDGVHPIEGDGTQFWAEVIRQGVAPLFV